MTQFLLLVLVLVPALTALQQYTPNQAPWATLTTKPLANGNTGHDPNGYVSIKAATWTAAMWNGTIYNPTKMTDKEFAAAICPTSEIIRGIRELYYAHKPFARVKNPTKAEIDEWHRIVINHIRALVGYKSADRQIQPDTCMCARALWGDERRFTTKWDAAYPGVDGSAAGPCTLVQNKTIKNPHCGATFIPNATDQTPYLPHGPADCFGTGGAEGIFGTYSAVPWSLKLANAFCGALQLEGFWGGHLGPFYHRQKFGFSFWDIELPATDSGCRVRAKWTGTLMPSLYCYPGDTTCVPPTGANSIEVASEVACDPNVPNSCNPTGQTQGAMSPVYISLIVVGVLCLVAAVIILIYKQATKKVEMV